jgi:sialate O-acetylesterase
MLTIARPISLLLRSIILLFILSLPTVMFGKVTLPPFFSDNMVLQQKSNAAIWGWANSGSNISVTTSWSKKKYSVKTGADGKWKLFVSTPEAGGPYTITVSDGSPVTLHNVLIGEVWLCSGQSNMEMPMKGFKDQPVLNANDAVFHSSNSNIRLYTVPRSVKLQPQDTTKNSSWKEADPSSVSNFSATAYYYGKILQETLHVPIGLINISYGGSSAEAWVNEQTAKSIPDLKLPTAADTAKANNRTATTLYNGMLHGFIGYGIKGCIWYQGESNYDHPDQYETLFPAMIKEWRTEFGQGDFPFYYVQIAPYDYAQLPPYNIGGKFNSAYLRDAQRKSLSVVPNSGMVVIMDIGEEKSIHPANKEVGGKRLAYLSLAKTYDLKGFGYTSPLFDSLSVSAGIATVRFKDCPNGLTSFGKPLSNFEIAGADKIFRPAKAMIYRGNVLVSSPDVKDPVAVRYAFKDFVVGDLFSVEGFPVSSFRTDSW